MTLADIVKKTIRNAGLTGLAAATLLSGSVKAPAQDPQPTMEITCVGPVYEEGYWHIDYDFWNKSQGGTSYDLMNITVPGGSNQSVAFLWQPPAWNGELNHDTSYFSTSTNPIHPGEHNNQFQLWCTEGTVIEAYATAGSDMQGPFVPVAVIVPGVADSDLRGTVYDSSKAAVPNADVRITNTTTGQSYTTQADETGKYSLAIGASVNQNDNVVAQGKNPANGNWGGAIKSMRLNDGNLLDMTLSYSTANQGDANLNDTVEPEEMRDTWTLKGNPTANLYQQLIASDSNIDGAVDGPELAAVACNAGPCVVGKASDASGDPIGGVAVTLYPVLKADSTYNVDREDPLSSNTSNAFGYFALTGAETSRSYIVEADDAGEKRSATVTMSHGSPWCPAFFRF